MARSLSDRTANLPEVKPVRKKTALGRRTRDAIQCGISLAAEGLIRRALSEHKGRVFGTGGDAPLYAEFFDDLVPDLVLEGIAWSWLKTHRP